MVFALSVGTTGFWAYGPLILKILFATNPLFSGYALAAEALAWSLATMAVSSAPVSADRRLIRGGAVAVVVGAAGFAAVLPAGSLTGHRRVLAACRVSASACSGRPSCIAWCGCRDASEQALAAASPSTIQRIGYAVGTAIAGIVANLSGLADGVSMGAAKIAAFWVFAAFFPVLAVALFGAWKFTEQSAATA